MNNTQDKTWCVVEVEDGVQLLPKSWIKDSLCYWPSFKSNVRYNKAVRCYEAVKDWQLFQIRKALGSYSKLKLFKVKVYLIGCLLFVDCYV